MELTEKWEDQVDQVENISSSGKTLPLPIQHKMLSYLLVFINSSVQSKNYGISVAWFSAHVINMHADKDREFQSEYEVSTTLPRLRII